MSILSKLSDEELAVVIRKGEKEAYAEIIRRYQSKLLRYAEYLLTDQHIAADAVQESFIKAYINLNGFDRKKKFSSWIYRIVHNQAMNVINKNKIQIFMGEDTDLDSGINLDDEIILKELRSHTKVCLTKMSNIFREPLSLYFLEEKSYEEISDILRIPISTVGSRINRAKKIMRKICQKKEQ